MSSRKPRAAAKPRKPRAAKAPKADAPAAAEAAVVEEAAPEVAAADVGQIEAEVAEAAAAEAAPEEAAAEVAAAPAPAPRRGAKSPDAPAHTAFLDHADKNAAASHGGVDIVRGENGLYLVPLAFVEFLQPHGFTVVSEGK